MEELRITVRDFQRALACFLANLAPEGQEAARRAMAEAFDLAYRTPDRVADHPAQTRLVFAPAKRCRRSG